MRQSRTRELAHSEAARGGQSLRPRFRAGARPIAVNRPCVEAISGAGGSVLAGGRKPPGRHEPCPHTGTDPRNRAKPPRTATTRLRCVGEFIPAAGGTIECRSILGPATKALPWIRDDAVSVVPPTVVVGVVDVWTPARLSDRPARDAKASTALAPMSRCTGLGSGHTQLPGRIEKGTSGFCALAA